MDMKWNPIVNGDLSGIPRDTRLLVTRTAFGRPYVDVGYLESILEKHAVIEVGDIGTLVKAEECVAWMKLPEPYNPTPDKCFKCNHGKLQHDEFSDNWFECELLQRGVPPNGKPDDCPLNR